MPTDRLTFSVENSAKPNRSSQPISRTFLIKQLFYLFDKPRRADRTHKNAIFFTIL